MKSTEFIMRSKKVIGSSVGFMITLLGQIIINCYMYATWSPTSHVEGAIAGNLMFLIMNIPALFIFRSYYTRSVRAKLVLTYEELSFYEGSELICSLKNQEITRVEIVSSDAYKLPWGDLSYMTFEDQEGKKIVVTNFILKPQEIWLDSLSRKMSNKRIVLTEKFFPSLPKKQTPNI